MRFRTTPPDPAEFPQFRLLWPPVVPAFILALVWVAEQSGHEWNIHGDAAIVLLVLLASVVVGSVSSGIALSSLVPALMEHQSLRTPANVACAVVSGAFLAACLVFVVFGFAKVVA